MTKQTQKIPNNYKYAILILTILVIVLVFISPINIILDITLAILLIYYIINYTGLPNNTKIIYSIFSVFLAPIAGIIASVSLFS